MKQNGILQEYLDKGFSIIPLKSGEKVSILGWKPYQKRKAEREEIESWCDRFKDFNPGIVTGDVSRLVVIDVDEPKHLARLVEQVPGAADTTRVKTSRGVHLYFESDRSLQTRYRFLDIPKVELRANGSYVVAPLSQVEDSCYIFEVPLSEIRPYPFMEELEIEERVPIPKFHSGDRDCIKQILERSIQEGERDVSLFVLFNLLIKHNTEGHSRAVVKIKNEGLNVPLSYPEIQKVWRKRYYNFSCKGVKSRLGFVDCDKCKFGRKRYQMKRSIFYELYCLREKPDLTGSELKVLWSLEAYFECKLPPLYKLSEVAKMNYRAAQKAVESLTAKGILP
ncbi:hypothetical protein ES703_26854 [subsurface metagenome]